MNKYKGNTDIVINSEILSELVGIAERDYCPYDVSELPYSEAQAVLTLFALETLLAKFNLIPPYKLDVVRYPEANDDADWDDVNIRQNKVGGRRGRYK